jgi:hypothetical protein
MKTVILAIFSAIACAAAICCFIGLVIGLVPAALIVPHLGDEGVKFQLSGVALAFASFAVLLVFLALIEKIRS